MTSSRAWVEPDPNLPGTHRPEGIVALSGTGLKAGRNLNVNLVDATPTILAFLGHTIPDHIEGVPIIGSAPPAEQTTSHTTVRRDKGTPALEGPHRRPFEYSHEEQAIIEQRLADLGYLE